jgi:hypothetical protein
MSTSNVTTNLTTLLSFDDFLDKFGYKPWQIVINTFILPVINFIGIGLCSFSLWVFTRYSFSDPIFFYYKLLCFVNILHLLHNIPYYLLFTPIYFSWIDTYAVAVFQIYFSFFSFFLFHLEDLLQIGILLHKMKIFSSFVRNHFQTTPKRNSFIFSSISLLLCLSNPFAFKIAPLGNYSYPDSNGVKYENTFYYLQSSDFSQTIFGQILLGFTGFFLSLFISLLIGVSLNIFSFIKFKSFVKKRQREVEELQMSSIYNIPLTSREFEQIKKLEKTEHKIERNMFYMALTLCSISILSRFLFMADYIYYFFFYSASTSIVLQVIANSVFTIVPFASPFVFFAFNKIFRDEIRKMCICEFFPK